jgi:hypothetical protein
MSRITNSIREGIRNVWAVKFLIGLMFVFKLISAFVLVFPLYLMFSSSFGANVKASNLLSGFDPTLLIDFVYHWKQTLSIYFLIFILACGIMAAVYIFLSGGFWGILRDQAKKKGLSIPVDMTENHLERFFGYSGRYLGGMLKIALLMIPLYLLAFLLVMIFNGIFSSIVGKTYIWEVTSWRMIVRLVVTLFLFLWFKMAGDYMRISLVKNQGETFWIVIKKAFRFVLTNASAALSLYYILAVIWLIIFLMYLGISRLAHGILPVGILVLVAFIVQQIYAAIVSFYRLVYYSSQLNLYDRMERGENFTESNKSTESSDI